MGKKEAMSISNVHRPLGAVVLFLSVVFAIPAHSAETIYLKDGRVIEADEINIKDGVLSYTIKGVPGIIALDRVQSIGKKPVDTPPSQKAPPAKALPPPSPPSDPNPIAAIPESKAMVDLKAELEKKYSGHYSTQKLLLDSGMRDYRSLCKMPPHPVSNQILTRLSRTYYPHFSTIWLLYKKEVEAYKELNK
jgi:hypothetical protein